MNAKLAPEQVPPGAVEALYATGHWLYSQGRIEHAHAVFRALIYLVPADERGWLALGACHEAMDQDEIALRIYEDAIPRADPAPRCEIARARILRRWGRTDEARYALNEASRVAEALRDDELLSIVAHERGRR